MFLPFSKIPWTKTHALGIGITLRTLEHYVVVAVFTMLTLLNINESHNATVDCSFLSSQKSEGQVKGYNVCSDEATFQCLSSQKPISIIQKSLQTISQLIGYHDKQSGSATPDAHQPVAQYGPSFLAWKYWEPFWNAREWRESSAAFQTGLDVESILSAWGIHRKWPSVCRQGKVSKCIVCRLIIEGSACWSSVWCNWVEMDGLPDIWLLQAELTEAIRSTWAHTNAISSAFHCTLYGFFKL